ncbi:hypothetical protein FCULG_00009145 [Fusarium culmorum]|uniref:Uncharacterized protein n=1 Tax=Fusarium culmorum TaxID=5516 RepID=A0A2T4GGQ4_FUSCU|nr:hypothetical protein FCULG_00009145 [Fusarium culmorum]
MSDKIPVQYSVDLSTNPSLWEDPNHQSLGFAITSSLDERCGAYHRKPDSRRST